MRSGSLVLLVGAAALVAVVHSVLPDHWVPLAVVARTQGWSLWRVGRISGLAAGGHVLASLILAGAIALVGLRFQNEIATQQGHIIGSILVLTGLGFLVWGMTGHGHAHGHEPAEHGHEEHGLGHEKRDHDHREKAYNQPDSHEHTHATTTAIAGEHVHRHAHAKLIHSHPHSHDAFVESRAKVIAQRSTERTLAARLAMIAVPFGVAASPDLTIMPVGLAASAYGANAVALVLAVFALITMATFVGLTVVATAVGYQFKGEWLEKNANAITSFVLIVIGVVAFVGF